MLNIQEYIESGRLEQYALGELPAAERVAVEEAAASHPAIAAELAAVVAALDGYALAHAVAPPPALRARVLSHVLAQIAPAETAAATSAETPAPMATQHETGAARPAATPALGLRADLDALAHPAVAAPTLLGQRPAPLAASNAPRARSPLALAASVALLLSLLGNAYLYNRWHETDATLVALQGDQTRLASANTVLQRTARAAEAQNDMLRDEHVRAVALAGTPAAPQARGRVFFDPATHRVFLDARRLPPLPAGKQYQLWALHNGKPVDAGLLPVGAGPGLLPMKEVAAAQAFAVTIEPVGGSATPTMPIQAMGAVAM